jgi:DNA-binding transcriptional MocR family regulator
MWIPDLPTDGTPIFRQLFAALERSIADGVLAVGSRLPPQRELAERLGVSVGTVTRAYEEADRRGLTIGHVGRGTYVSGFQDLDSVRKPSEIIDLSMNCPPMVAAERLLAETWGKVRRRRDFLDVLNYAPIEGANQHRRMAAAWLARTARLETSVANRMVITAGCQAAMDTVISQICKPGDTILAEELTFSGIKSIARQRGYKLVGVSMDREGIDPEALAKAAKVTGATVLYTMPTLHNPTGRTMSASRRKDVIKVARKAQLTIVEDDVYAVFADPRLDVVPLSVLAPELCYYVSGLSKSIAPGLRTGFAVAPDETHADGLAQAVRAACFATQSMGLLIAQQAIEDGAAEQIVKENRRIVYARNALLRKGLEKEESKPALHWSPHVWMPMSEAESERIEAKLFREGVRLTPFAVPRMPGAREGGLRICVGAPRREEDFRRAVALLQRALQDRRAEEQAFV